MTVDPATGNVLPNTVELTYELFLRRVGPEQNTDYPGVDARSDVLEGYCIDPQVLDSRITGGTQGRLVFAGEPEAECEVLQPGSVYGSSGLLGQTLQQVLGDRVRLLRVWVGAYG